MSLIIKGRVPSSVFTHVGIDILKHGEFVDEMIMRVIKKIGFQHCFKFQVCASAGTFELLGPPWRACKRRLPSGTPCELVANLT